MSGIKNLLYFVLKILFGLCAIPVLCNGQTSLNLTNYVNPFIGTAPLTNPEIIGYTPPEGWRVWAGLTYPGAALPNGMVQLSPVTKFGSGSGYQYEDSVIIAFTHTNKGQWNLCNIPVLPVTGNVNPEHFGSHYDHDSETAHPGCYQVFLKDYNINVKLTVTPHCGFHLYHFPKGVDKEIVFDLEKANNHVKNWNIHQDGVRAISGYQNTGQTIYFYATFNQDISDINQLSNGNDTISIVHINSDDPDQTVEMRIGLSFVSTENAKENLQREVSGRSFENIERKASQTWEKLLEHIQVSGGTLKERKLFYTSLYRAFLWPELRSDANGEYRDVKGNVIRSVNFNYYTLPSLWDTYRNKLILMQMLEPEVTRDVIKSLIDRGEKTGFIPTFFFGDPACVFIEGAYLRGLRGFNVKEAYRLMINNATLAGGTRPYIEEYMKKGYVSTPEVEHPRVETKAKAGVASTLEYAYADYAIARLAKALGDGYGFKRFMKRSENYKNVFDPTTGFMRGRLANGKWVTPFNPQQPYYEYMYREANAWQSTFYVPQDVQGLIDLFGSKKRFEAKLDSLFSLHWDPGYIARNISCFVGQYCQGNQPDHNFPFLYYFVGEQQKTQKILNCIMTNLYGIGKQGLALPGMDDAGEMSSWYVFNAMGFYPFSPADTYYLVTVPVFDKVKLKLKGHPSFVIKRQGGGTKIEGITLNGEKLKSLRIYHRQIERGGLLRIEAYSF
ncbi:MAG: glycoside hydrolase family 92 protein [Chitinophagaceae bacterium]|nr:MAG: glycoside hydrolase family 92 protein [Chitinophagaceae bacterium]